jgi:diacylglycerol kinase (ATP)
MKNQNFIRRFKFAFAGIEAAIRREASLRFQLLCALGAFLVLFYLKPIPIWWAMVFLTISGVLGAEMFNTALECLMDHLHPEQHAAIKFAKDCAAGAVLIFSLASIGVLIALLVNSF